MKEQGIVKKIEGELVWISTLQCAGCESGAHCGSCAPEAGGSEAPAYSGHHELSHEIAIFGIRKERLFTVRNSHSLELKTGDRVEYFVAPGKAMKAGFLVLIVPLLAFFLLYYLSAALWSGIGETFRILAGVGGIALGFAMNLAFKKNRQEYPEITRVLR